MTECNTVNHHHMAPDEAEAEASSMALEAMLGKRRCNSINAGWKTPFKYLRSELSCSLISNGRDCEWISIEINGLV